MLQSLEIENFKSIKKLVFPCKKFNVFIGEPNTGKSNILEVIGLLSSQSYGSLTYFVRMEHMHDLFYDQNIEEKILIRFNELILELGFDIDSFALKLYKITNSEKEIFKSVRLDSKGTQILGGSHPKPKPEILRKFKFYRFKTLTSYSDTEFEFLLPPYGYNLSTILTTHKSIKNEISQIFKKFGFQLMFEKSNNELKMIKLREDFIISFPFSLISDTLQRIVFFLTAILSNKDSVIVFEEPESNSFPYYTKYLAEKIALEENNNQYFISTHNPYFLLSLLEKVPSDNINVFVTFFKNYQTNIKVLTKQQLKKIMDLEIDMFFNIESFLEKDE